MPHVRLVHHFFVDVRLVVYGCKEARDMTTQQGTALESVFSGSGQFFLAIEIPQTIIFIIITLKRDKNLS